MLPTPTFLNLTIQRGGEILESEAQIRPSAVKWLNFGKFQFFFEFLFVLRPRTSFNSYKNATHLGIFCSRKID